MANLTPTPGYDNVPELDTTTPVLAGPGGPSNSQAQALLNRTEQLKNEVSGKATLTSALPVAETVGATAALGTSLEAARSDHRHAMPGLATETAPGFVELATSAEVIAGTDTERVLTPAGLAARTSTDSRTGLVELATDAETQTGTDAARAVTPAGLSSRTATETRTGLIELATAAEVQALTDALRAITPAGLAAVATALNTALRLVQRDASGNFAAGTITAALNGNASTATKLSGNRSTWSGDGVFANVVGQLAWRDYGNGHTIFDASAGLSPDGSSVNNTFAQFNWQGTYPTLMGWNGSGTYGVRVDSARRADSAATADDNSHNHNAATIAGAFNAGGLQSLGTSGYQRLPGGLILQWGSIPTSGPQTVSFPIAFPNAVFSVAVSINGSSGSAFTWAQARITNTLTQISTASGGESVRYIAIGY